MTFNELLNSIQISVLIKQSLILLKNYNLLYGRFHYNICTVLNILKHITAVIQEVTNYKNIYPYI